MSDYDACADILTDALEKMAKRGVIFQSDILPTFVDYTASLAIALGGEDAVRACIIRMGQCIADYHKGKFPVRTN